MANKIDEQNDYLQSLFSKPFCQKMQEQVTLGKVRNSTSNRNDNNHKNGQIYNHYHFILSQDSKKHANKIYNQSSNRNMSNRITDHKKVTPYQSWKIQEKIMSKQLKNNINRDQISKNLNGSQDSWLIINQLQTKLKETSIRKSQFNKRHKNQLSNLNISQIILPNHRKKYSQSSIKQKIKTQVSLQSHKDQHKNIKSMMSYYKNKRAIKQMTKINSASFNLTNSQIQQCTNLKVEAINKNGQKIQDLIQKVKLSYHKNRKIKMKDKNRKVEILNFSSDKIKIPFKSAQSNPFNIQSRQLNGILNSFKIDMSEKQRRPKTQTRINKSQHYSPSKKSTTSKRFNDVTGWQNFFQKSQSQTVCLI